MPPSRGWDATLRTSSAEVRVLPVVPRVTPVTQSSLLRRRLGRAWSPKPGSRVRSPGGVPRERYRSDLGRGRTAHNRAGEGSSPSAATTRRARRASMADVVEMARHRRSSVNPSPGSPGRRWMVIGYEPEGAGSNPAICPSFSRCSSVVRARGRGPRGRRCDSGHLDDSFQADVAQR